MGFDGRVFLLDSEYETYMRRMPVRYIRHKISNVCAICGKEATKDNPLEKAHLIPFNAGIKKYRLTPDFLDRKENIVAAHRKTCNKLAELSHEEILKLISPHLAGLSVTYQPISSS